VTDEEPTCDWCGANAYNTRQFGSREVGFCTRHVPNFVAVRLFTDILILGFFTVLGPIYFVLLGRRRAEITVPRVIASGLGVLGWAFLLARTWMLVASAGVL